MNSTATLKAKVARDKLVGGADFLAVISFPIDERTVEQRTDKLARQKLKKLMKRTTLAAAEVRGRALVLTRQQRLSECTSPSPLPMQVG
jgi:hypothetical protein